MKEKIGLKILVGMMDRGDPYNFTAKELFLEKNGDSLRIIRQDKLHCFYYDKNGRKIYM